MLLTMSSQCLALSLLGGVESAPSVEFAKLSNDQSVLNAPQLVFIGEEDSKLCYVKATSAK